MVAFLGSKMEQVGGRHALIPGVILIFIVFRFFQTSNGISKIVSVSLITISLLTGAYEFKYNNLYPKLLICYECPHWKEEVYKWKQDDTYFLKIWNYPKKTMSLSY